MRTRGASDEPKSTHAERSADLNRPRRVPAPVDTTNLFTVDEAAQRTRLSRRTLTRAVTTGRLAVVRVGRTLRFRDEDLAAFVAANRVPALREVQRKDIGHE